MYNFSILYIIKMPSDVSTMIRHDNGAFTVFKRKPSIRAFVPLLVPCLPWPPPREGKVQHEGKKIFREANHWLMPVCHVTLRFCF